MVCAKVKQRSYPLMRIKFGRSFTVSSFRSMKRIKGNIGLRKQLRLFLRRIAETEEADGA